MMKMTTLYANIVGWDCFPNVPFSVPYFRTAIMRNGHFKKRECQQLEDMSSFKMLVQIYNFYKFEK
jgi:hypothetical protein